MSRRLWPAVLALCLVLVVAPLAWVSCTSDYEEADGASAPAYVEVTEYEGRDLSSIDDFRENSIKGPQYVDLDSYRLQVTGLVERPASYSFDEVVEGFTAYEKVVTLHCVEGWSAAILWEGVRLRDLIEVAGPTLEAEVAIFHAYDGYTTALPLGYLVEQDIIMAHKMNGVLLPPERGAPFQLVAESKWGYKWIKWVTEIELSADGDYKGFWERVGYSNSANEMEPFFDR